jgi:hypothetical protein
MKIIGNAEDDAKVIKTTSEATALPILGKLAVKEVMLGKARS